MLDALLELCLTPAFAVVAGSAVVGGFLRGFVGFGGGLVCVPIITVVFSPVVAVPVSTVMAFPAIFQLLPTALRDAERPIVGPLAVGTLIAAPIGSGLLIAVDANVMKVAISIFVLAMVWLLALNWRFTGAMSPGPLVGCGAVAGFLQGSAGVGGPPLVAIALSRQVDARQQRGNVVGAITAVSIAAIGPHWYFGLFTLEVFLIGIVLIPLYSGATWIGARYFFGEGARHFHRVALLVLALIGFATLGFSLHGLWFP